MILFFQEDILFKLPSPRCERGFLKQLITDESGRVGDINIIFCSDKYLLEINRKYLNHDYYTDVITFDTSEDPECKKISGDIFISIDTVRSNSEHYGVSFEEELSRVMAHGLLHLVGYDDCDEESKFKMREKEDSFLRLKGFLKNE